MRNNTFENATHPNNIEHINILLFVIAAAYLMLAVAAPIFYHFQLPGTIELYKFGKTLCVQRPSRCLWFLNDHTALCAKCFGLYFGILLSSLVILTKGVRSINKPLGLIMGGSVTILFVSHSIYRSQWGGLLMPIELTVVFGVLAGICFTMFVSFIFCRLSQRMTSIFQRAWIPIIILLVLFHVWGAAVAFADSSQTTATQTNNKQTTDQDIQKLKKEIEQLKQEATQARKANEARDLRDQAAKLKKEVEQLKSGKASGAGPASASTPTQTAQEDRVKAARVMIPAGTPVILTADVGFSAEDVKEGDHVALLVKKAVRIDETTVIRRGVSARVHVASIKKPTSWGGHGEMSLNVKSVPAVDGSQVMLTGRAKRQGDSSHGEAAALAIGTAIICLPLALTGFAVTGEEGEFPAGYEIVAHADGNHWVKIYTKAQMQKIAEEQEQEAAETSNRFRDAVESQKKKRQEEKPVDDVSGG